jgi:hypothetical protein
MGLIFTLAPANQAPKMPAVAVDTWTGIYFDVNGGYGFGQSTPMSLISDIFSAFNYNSNGWLVAGTAGAQILSGHTIIGIEADIDWANITGSKRARLRLTDSGWELRGSILPFHPSVPLEHELGARPISRPCRK